LGVAFGAEVGAASKGGNPGAPVSHRQVSRPYDPPSKSIPPEVGGMQINYSFKAVIGRVPSARRFSLPDLAVVQRLLPDQVSLPLPHFALPH